MNTIEINAPAATVREFFIRPELVLRLHPSWYLKEIKPAEEDVYDITLYDDKMEEIRRIVLTVEVRESSINYIMNSDMTEFFIQEVSPAITRLSIEGDFIRDGDLPYWLKGLKNYIRLEVRQSRIVKFLLDRFWLGMTPSQRRIAIIIIISEGIGLAALAAVVLAIKLLK
jgi:hypothetical protein